MSGLFVAKAIPPMSLQMQAQWLVELLDRHPDLDPSRTSRFAKMSRAVLAEGPEVIRADRPDFPATLQAMKDLRELHFIWHILEPKPLDTAFWKKLKEVFGDVVLPSEATGKSGARNTQFELFSRAILERADMHPQPLPRDADFRCQFGRWSFAVEAKRISSLKQLRAKTSDAADQTHETALPGILFVDFSEAVNPGDKLCVRSSPIPDFGQAQNTRHQQFWKEHGDEVKSAVRRKGVLAATFFDHLIIQQGHSSPGVGSWEFATIRDNVKLVEHSQLEDVLNALNYVGLPNSEL